ncbi:MAG: hypothetical protein RLZZ156_133 [Deinococcota bacterium]|jgi:hypothetical protein
MFAQNLHILLEDASKQARNVELYFRGKVNHHLVSGSVFVVSGEIQHFALGQHSGRTALQYLPQVDLVMAVALPLEKAPPSRDQNTPDTHEVLRQLKIMIFGPEQTIEPSPIQVPVTKNPTIEPVPNPPYLYNQVESILHSVFGTGASIQLSKIAQKFPPRDQPLAFLLECKNLLVPMIGEESAKKMLEHLYKEI